MHILKPLLAHFEKCQFITIPRLFLYQWKNSIVSGMVSISGEYACLSADKEKEFSMGNIGGTSGLLDCLLCLTQQSLLKQPQPGIGLFFYH